MPTTSSIPPTESRVLDIIGIDKIGKFCYLEEKWSSELQFAQISAQTESLPLRKKVE